MHDGITIEQYGVPVAVICTEPFAVTAQAMAHLKGIRDFPFITIPHPIGNLSTQELKERAQHATLGVERVLIAGGKVA